MGEYWFLPERGDILYSTRRNVFRGWPNMLCGLQVKQEGQLQANQEPGMYKSATRPPPLPPPQGTSACACQKEYIWEKEWMKSNERGVVKL